MAFAVALIGPPLNEFSLLLLLVMTFWLDA